MAEIGVEMAPVVSTCNEKLSEATLLTSSMSESVSDSLSTDPGYIGSVFNSLPPIGILSLSAFTTEAVIRSTILASISGVNIDSLVLECSEPSVVVLLEILFFPVRDLPGLTLGILPPEKYHCKINLTIHYIKHYFTISSEYMSLVKDTLINPFY